MNETIIKNWNSRVKPEDQVYHVGDFCFKNSKGGKQGEGMIHKASYYSDMLNGNIIHIRGNHDKNNSVRTLIEKIIIRYGNHYVCLVHDPRNYDMNYAINFVGHVHEKWKFRRIINPMFEEKYVDLINVGVDVWNFKPVTFEEIYSSYKSWTRHGSKIVSYDEKHIKK